MDWKPDTRKYMSGEVLYLGPWQVGGAHLDTTVPRGQRDRYRASCGLPGVSSSLGLHESMETAKARVEQATSAWLAKLPDDAIATARLKT